MNYTIFQSYELGYTSFLTLFASTPSALSDEVGTILGLKLTGTPAPRAIGISSLGNHEPEFNKFTEEQQRDLILSFCTVNHELRHVRQLGDNTFLPYILLERLKCLSSARLIIIDAKRSGAKELKVPALNHPEQFAAFEQSESTSIGLSDVSRLMELLNILCGYESKPLNYLKTISEDITRYLGWSRHYVLDADNWGNETTSPFQLNLSHLLEAQCRIEDLAAATSLMVFGKLQKEFVTKIINELWKTEGYREAYDFFSHNTAGSLPDKSDKLAIFQVLIFIALNPVIPSFNAPPDFEICWQQMQPVWRFAQCVLWVKINGWPFDKMNPESAIEPICKDLNFAPISKALGDPVFYKSPLDMPEDIAGIDILNRHKTYKRFAAQKKYFISATFPDSEKVDRQTFMEKNLPWFRTASDGTIDVQCLPENSSLHDVFVAAALVNTMEAVLFGSDLGESEQFFYKIRDACLKLSPADTSLSALDFAAFFEVATEFGLDEVSRLC